MSLETIIAPVMTFLGLVVCFGSTYFKKICSALTGFVWGTLAAAIAQLIAGGLFDVNDDFVLISLGAGVVCAIALYMFDSLAGAINAFFLVALLALIFGIVYLESYFDSFEGLGIFAIVAGLIAGGIAFIFDKYAFAISTAVAGATFSGLGGICLIHNISLSDAVGSIFYGGFDIFSSLPVIIIVLGGIGAAFQLYGLSVAQRNAGGGKLNYAQITEQVMAFIKRNMLVSIVPVLAAFIPALCGLFLNGGIGGSITSWITLLAQSIVLGSIVYLVSENKLKSGVALGALYNAFYIIVNFKSYFVNEYGWPIDWGTFRAIETAIILAALAMIIKPQKIKLAVLPAIAYFTFHYLMSYISVKEIFAISFNAYEALGFIAVYLTVMALYYKCKGTIIYKDKTSVIVLLIVLAFIIGIFILQKVALKMDEKEAKGGWQNYKEEQKEYKKDWNIIKNDNQYPKLIEGDITVDQLREALGFFDSPVDSEEIDDAFAENSYWYTFLVCDRPEEQRDESTDPYSVYEYDLKEVNGTLSGLTNFQFEDNSWYGDEPEYYTEDGILYLYMLPTGWDNDRIIKNIRGRYNDDELIVDYDWYQYDYYSDEPEEEFLYSLTAVFTKNENGKYKLNRIVNYEQESDSSGNEEKETAIGQNSMLDETVWDCTRGLEPASSIKFHSDGSFDEYFYDDINELVENAGTWKYDAGSETLYLTDYSEYTDKREVVFVKMGTSFRSSELIEMMGGEDYQWLDPTDDDGVFE